MLRTEILIKTVFLPVLLAVLLMPALVIARPDFQSMLTRREFKSLLTVEDVVLGGLDGGGLLLWDADDPAGVTQVFSGQSLGGNIITDMAYSGQHVWVATQDGGLTRITDVAGSPAFRLYTGNLGSLDITALAGTVIGSSERVYYAMAEAGLGVITEGLPGAIYTADQDGLLNNSINDLVFHEGDLYIATPTGVCRFADNAFTTINDGLGNLIVRVLAVDTDGTLVCGGNGGVYRWDPETSSWNSLGWGQGWATQLSANAEGLWVMSVLGNGNGNLGLYADDAWTYPELPRQVATAMHAGPSLWVGGQYSPAGMNPNSNGFAWVARRDGSDTWTEQIQDALLPYNVCGLAIEDDGTRWGGSRNGKALTGVAATGNHHLYEVAAVENDSIGLFNQYAPMLSMAADDAGVVYTGQYSSGIIRFNKNSEELDLIHPGNSGMAGPHVINMVMHPDGPLFMMHDWADAQKVQVLLDPERWDDPASWLDVPQGAEGIGTGIGVPDIAVESRDVIWLAVEGLGVVRWDTNGLLGGPEDDLTWDDFSDDFWTGPIGEVELSNNDLTKAVALDLAPDGSLWIGGDGVTRVTFDGNAGLILQEDYSTKAAEYEEGLISGTVKDLAVDRNGDLWVLSAGGLNRVAWDTARPEIDAYFNLALYLGTPTYPELYSTNAVAGIPGGTYFRLVASADRSHLALSSSTGAVSWPITEEVGTEASDLAGVYFYPQPFMPGQDDGRLKMAGVPADAFNSDGALVEIYNLQGQLVYRNSQVSEADGFWNGQNRVGNPVATGMYLLKLTWRNQVTTRSLAVVR